MNPTQATPSGGTPDPDDKHVDRPGGQGPVPEPDSASEREAREGPDPA